MTFSAATPSPLWERGDRAAVGEGFSASGVVATVNLFCELTVGCDGKRPTAHKPYRVTTPEGWTMNSRG